MPVTVEVEPLVETTPSVARVVPVTEPFTDAFDVFTVGVLFAKLPPPPWHPAKAKAAIAPPHVKMRLSKTLISLNNKGAHAEDGVLLRERAPYLGSSRFERLTMHPVMRAGPRLRE